MSASWRVAVMGLLLLGADFALAEPPPSGYSAAGLYNLANSYARADKPGLAILNYKRAALLSPTDADIDANYRHVLATVHLPIESRGWIDRTRLGGPLAAWLGVVGVVIVGTSLVATRFTLRLRRTRWFCILLGSAMVGVTLLNACLVWPLLHEGVVIAPAAPVRASPVPMADTLFSLDQAETVKVSAEHEGFLLIQTRAGRTGWMSSATVARVVPRE